MFLVHYQDCSPRQICLTETTFERDQKKLHEHFSVSYQTYVLKKNLRSCFELFEMFFEVKRPSFSSRFFSQIAPLSSLEEAVETEVFHSQTFKQAIQNSFLKSIEYFFHMQRNIFSSKEMLTSR